MLDMMIFFGVPFFIGLFIGFCFKGFLSRYKKRRAFDRHMDELFEQHSPQ